MARYRPKISEFWDVGTYTVLNKDDIPRCADQLPRLPPVEPLSLPKDYPRIRPRPHP